MKSSGGNQITLFSFRKYILYIMDLTFYRYGFGKNEEITKGYTICQIHGTIAPIKYNVTNQIGFNSCNEHIFILITV